MIVQASIDEAGGVAVSIDSDGDQGDCYSSEILDDLLKRAGRKAVSLWRATHPAEKSDGTPQ